MITDFTNKAYLSAITVTNISQSFLPTRCQQKSTGIDMEQNYVIVTQCIAILRPHHSTKPEYESTNEKKLYPKQQVASKHFIVMLENTVNGTYFTRTIFFTYLGSQR